MFDKMINERISFGLSSSASKEIRTALHLLESEENKYEALMSELESGEESKIVDNFDRQENLKKLHAKHLSNEI